MLTNDGWYEVKRAGSHIHFRHAVKSGLVIVPFHAGKELSKGVERSILKQAGLG